jgi:hypothetical protein
VVLALTDTLEVSTTRRLTSVTRRAVGAARAAATADFVVALPEFVLGELDTELKSVRVRKNIATEMSFIFFISSSD